LGHIKRVLYILYRIREGKRRRRRGAISGKEGRDHKKEDDTSF